LTTHKALKLAEYSLPNPYERKTYVLDTIRYRKHNDERNLTAKTYNLPYKPLYKGMNSI